MKYDLKKLREEYNTGKKLEFVFFWSHQECESITKTCFSNWYASEFSLDHIRYKTTEHYMMAKKAELFKDHEFLKKIMEADSPKVAKELGRLVRGFTNEIWDQYKYDIVLQANLAKFSQHPKLKEFILSTADKILVEASPHDNIWGIGMNEHHKDVKNPNLWRGKNLLGFVLMEVRDGLREKH